MTYTIKLVDTETGETVREIEGVLKDNVIDARNTFQGYRTPGASQTVTVTRED